MNIKEMEERSGLPRSGIRFYESEGLLSPARSANGYRDYSESDLETLLKIKRLRALGLTLSEIRSVQSGASTLAGELSKALARLGEQRGGLAGAEAECRAMLASGADWDSLLTSGAYAPSPSAPGGSTGILYGSVGASTAPEWWSGMGEPGPVRRFFARWLDICMCTALICVFNILVLRVNPALDAALDRFLIWFFSVVLLLVFEPLCLHLFAATPGKWMLGITVRAWDGGKLSYREAYIRTRRVLIGGMGFYIPIAEPVANAIALWRSLKEREQPWDAEYGRWVTVYRPRRSWRSAACAVAYVLSAILIVAISVPYGSMPSNRGDMSAAEFSDNYNDLAAYIDFGEYEHMTPDGLMTDMPPNIFVLRVTDGGSIPEFTLTESDGLLTRVEFTAEKSVAASADATVDTYVSYMQLAVMSYVWGRPGAQTFDTDERNAMLDYLDSHSFESFETERAGVRVRCDVNYSGYSNSWYCLYPVEGENQSFELHFALELV